MRAFLLVLSLLLFSQGAIAQTSKPFGMEEISIQTGNVVKKWKAVRQASRADSQSEKLLEFAEQFAKFSGRSLVGHVNLAVNQLLRPTDDIVQWGEVDHWSPALETLVSGKGDCEDYVILKYAILKLYLPASSLKLVVGHDSLRNQDHMLLLAWIDGGWLVLNNRINALVSDTDLVGKWFEPTFSLTEEGAFKLERPFQQAQVQK